MSAAIAEDAITPTELAAQEAEYEKFVWKHLPRNFAGHYLHGMLGMTGFRLFNAPTFLPAYLHMITGSAFLVGVGQSLQQLGGVVSPIIGAAHIEHRKKVLPAAMVIGTLMRLQILGVAVVGFLLHGQALVISTMIFLFLFGLFSGPQGVAFQTLLAKVIPIARRGRLQAYRNVTGGAIAAGLAWFAGKYLIQGNVWGNGYATTFLLAVALTSAGLTALRLLMIEPVPPTIRARSRVLDRVREFPKLVTQDRGFMFFMIAQTLATAGRVAAPFYILYAGHSMKLSGENIGFLSLAFLGADTATNMIWGLLGDRFGFKMSFVGALVVWVAATALLMAAPHISSDFGVAPLIFMAFFGLGAAQSGYLMSAQTMVLEFGARDDIAMRLALTATSQGAVNAIGPLAGGAIAATLGYEVLFGVSIVMLIASLLLLVIVVEEPRFRKGLV